MKIVVGLGNPGREYERTRHNVGFMVCEALARAWNAEDWKRERRWNARLALARTQETLLVEPLAYMNESGGPMQAVMTFYKVTPPGALVVVDDLDLPFGTLRMRERGGAGGHNGLKSIIERIGEDFPRLRIGIGRGAHGDAIDRVLGPFSADEERVLPELIASVTAGIETWRTLGPVAAMNAINGKRS